MKRLIILAGISFCLKIGVAQTEFDALRYSQLGFGGTARYSGMGGAFGALGGDQSTLSTNPAGLGFYRKSEVTFTPVVNASMTTGLWNGIENRNAKENFHIDNFGYVGSIKIDKYNWYNLNIGLVSNRFNTFSRTFDVTNSHSSTSLLDVFANDASGYYPSELDEVGHFTSNLAYMTYLIDPDTNTWNYYSPLYDNTIMQQDKKVDQRGRQTETDLSIGTNYNDRLYLGLTLGFPGIVYREKSIHSEVPNPDTLDLRRFSYTEILLTEGSGFNTKFGIIARLTDFMRVGLAAHTPTWYNMEDSYKTEMYSKFGINEEYKEASDDGNYKYKLVTPARFIGSMAFIFDKKGLLSFDLEYVDYSKAKLKAKGTFGEEEFRIENDIIKANYKPALNLRLGGEIRITNNFNVRGGYAIYQSAYKRDASFFDRAQVNYTGGLGFRNSNFFADLAFTLNTKEEDYGVYSLELDNPAIVNTTTSRVIATVGFRF